MSKTLREDVAEWLANPRRVEELTAYIEAALREAVREERKALRLEVHRIAEVSIAELKAKAADILPGDAMEVGYANAVMAVLAALDARDAEPKEGCAWCKNPMPHEHER